MRKVTLAIAVFIFLSGNFVFAQEAPDNKVTAYYFHGAFRCPTCMTMEKYSREAIETNFKDELSSGEVEFKVVDVEKKGNEHFAKEYSLYTKSLVLSLVEGGKEVKYKNLDKIWEYVRDRQRFIAYVTQEMDKYLKEIE